MKRRETEAQGRIDFKAPGRRQKPHMWWPIWIFARQQYNAMVPASLEDRIKGTPNREVDLGQVSVFWPEDPDVRVRVPHRVGQLFQDDTGVLHSDGRGSPERVAE